MIKKTIKNLLSLCFCMFAFVQLQAQAEYKVMNATSAEGKTLGVDIDSYEKTEVTFSGEDVTITVDGKKKTLSEFSEGVFTFTESAATSTANISDAGFATFCSPMEVVKPEGVVVYKVNELRNNGAIIEELSQTSFPMGEGLLLKGDAGKYDFTQILFPNDEAADVEGNILVGAVMDTGVKAKSVFTLGRNRESSKIGFWRYTGTNVKAGTAYIDGNSMSQSLEGAPIVWEETTEIQTASAEAQGLQQQYNLAGQKVSHNYKGIVVSENGKKYMRR